MKRSLLYVVAGFVGIMLLLIACIAVQILIANDIVYSIVVVGSGLFVFFICILAAQDVGVTWISSPEHIRATIAIAIVVEYMVMVGIAAFFHGWGKDPIPPVTQTLITSFTSVVGVVIAFFFGASAYVQRHRGKRERVSPTGDEHKS